MRSALRMMAGLTTALFLYGAIPAPVFGAERAVEAPPIAQVIDEAAARFGLPANWIRAVIWAESGGDPRAISSKGAMGLMQLMPSTWRALTAQHQLGPDPFDSRANVLAGAAYLRQLFDQFGAEGFLAAYNAGPARYAEARAGRRDLPAETVIYVAKVERAIATAGGVRLAPSASVRPDWRVSSLFVMPADLSEAIDVDLFPGASSRVSP